MENTVSKPVKSTLTITKSYQKFLSSSSWLLNALKSFESVNSILLTKSVTYQGKNLLLIYVHTYSVSFSVISGACFNVFVSRARELKLKPDLTRTVTENEMKIMTWPDKIFNKTYMYNMNGVQKTRNQRLRWYLCIATNRYTSGQRYMTTSIIQSHKLDRTVTYFRWSLWSRVDIFLPRM